MRILMLTCHPHIRGPFPKILPLLAASLRSEGCHVVEEPWGRHSEDESLFDKVVGRLGDLLRICRRFRRERFDILVVQTTTEWRNYSRDIPAIWLSRFWIPSVVVQFHGSTPEMALGPGHSVFKRATRILFNLADAVIVSSSEEQRGWQKFCPGSRYFTARNPFLQVAGRPLGDHAEPWELPKDVPILLYVGRLILEKGILDLLEALSHVTGKVPFHLLVIGSGPAEQEFRAAVPRLGLGDKITVAGHVDEKALRHAYHSADAFVLPSWSEGLPTVLLEAMDAGLPIVTTRIRGAADYLQEGINALLVPPRDSARLAEALATILTRADLRSAMSKANREKVREFAPEAVASEYLLILRGIVDSNSPTADSPHGPASSSVPEAGRGPAGFKL